MHETNVHFIESSQDWNEIFNLFQNRVVFEVSYSPLWDCAGDRVEMVVKVLCWLFWGTHFQLGSLGPGSVLRWKRKKYRRAKLSLLQGSWFLLWFLFVCLVVSWCFGWVQTPNDVTQKTLPAKHKVSQQCFPQQQETPVCFAWFCSDCASRKAIGFISKTTALHVHHVFLYIF